MSDDTVINRKAAVAGSFYPGSKAELTQALQKLFSVAEPAKGYTNITAIICPHAGYVFSGEVAASAYNQIPKDKQYENVFILGSSHRASFDYASIYSDGNFITPLGVAEVNRSLARKLQTDNPELFKSFRDPHIYEHSIEVQVPFLQFIFKDNLRIVPILLGTQRNETCKKLASALKPYFTEKNLFVISSDFSHYPNYHDACIVDAATANAILKNSTSDFLQTLEKNENQGYAELVTSVCGWTSVLCLLYMTEKNAAIKYYKIQYKNSGDTPYGDKDRVVGYNAILVTSDSQGAQEEKDLKERTNFTLTEEDKSQLLRIARETISEYLETGKTRTIMSSQFSSNLKRNAGAFVTLNKEGELRGCIGRFTANSTLFELVQEMAIASATKDYRFSPVTRGELPVIDIEISVLTPLHKIESVKEIVLGKHGIYIKKGNSSGTFLPQVASQTGWSLDDFLGHCSRDKAGLGWDEWKTAEVFTYEAIVFGEKKINH
jgi:AmmeMemoRadiSam system protein B/AmmeMemoRadiSam system protein A